jgi:hypothetical protein
MGNSLVIFTIRKWMNIHTRSYEVELNSLMERTP